MTDMVPPVSPDDPLGVQADLEYLARLLYSQRSGIAIADLDTMFEMNPVLQDEFDALMDTLANPDIQSADLRIFEVSPSPEGEFVDRAGRHAIVSSYTLNFVPNRKRRTIAPWAFFGQR